MVPVVSSALYCPFRHVLVLVYYGSRKAFMDPRVLVHIGRRGRPVEKPLLMLQGTALSLARRLHAARVGTSLAR